MRLHTVWLGRIGYRAAAELQEAARRRVLAALDRGDREAASAAETLFLLEHDPVITLGRGAQSAHVLASSAELGARGIRVERSTRGGDVTYHGPGQLVAYPVMRLDRGIVHHVESLAAAVVEVAADYGIEARFRRDCPGVWVQERKLAAFGVHVHRRVAIHGVALNVTTALDAFELIVPCGLRGSRATSLAAETGRSPRLVDVARRFAGAYGGTLGRTIEWNDFAFLSGVRRIPEERPAGRAVA